jgi:hypothetical protein
MQQFSKGLFACDVPKPTACETALCARAGRAEESQRKSGLIVALVLLPRK